MQKPEETLRCRLKQFSILFNAIIKKCFFVQKSFSTIQCLLICKLFFNCQAFQVAKGGGALFKQRIRQARFRDADVAGGQLQRVLLGGAAHREGRRARGRHRAGAERHPRPAPPSCRRRVRREGFGAPPAAFRPPTSSRPQTHLDQLRLVAPTRRPRVS